MSTITLNIIKFKIGIKKITIKKSSIRLRRSELRGSLVRLARQLKGSLNSSPIYYNYYNEKKDKTKNSSLVYNYNNCY